MVADTCIFFGNRRRSSGLTFIDFCAEFALPVGFKDSEFMTLFAVLSSPVALLTASGIFGLGVFFVGWVAPWVEDGAAGG